MRLYIKYMVSLRCKMFVKTELEKLGVEGAEVELGVVDIPGELSPENQKILQQNLKKAGLELLVSKKSVLTERIKQAVIKMVYADELPKLMYSEYLSEKLKCNYTCLSEAFSETTGMSIQQFIVANKVDRVKDLILNSDLTLTEISFKLNYSSVAHLSNQFKKNTGFTPSAYKQIMSEREPCGNREAI